MKNTVITVGSITYAMKLRKLLTKEKIGSRLVKLENSNDNMGCVHGVEINPADLFSAVGILKKNNIKYSIK